MDVSNPSVKVIKSKEDLWEIEQASIIQCRGGERLRELESEVAIREHAWILVSTETAGFLLLFKAILADAI